MEIEWVVGRPPGMGYKFPILCSLFLRTTSRFDGQSTACLNFKSPLQELLLGTHQQEGQNESLSGPQVSLSRSPARCQTSLFLIWGVLRWVGRWAYISKDQAANFQKGSKFL